MLKFMKHQQKLTPERIQKQKELFAFTRACQHGFPPKPSAMDYDPELKLLAIATRTAAITIYGAPGVEFYGQHDSHEHAVTALCFVPGQGILMTLCADNTLHQWHIQGNGGPQSSQLLLKHSTTLEGKLKRISVMSCCIGSNNLLVGTEGGNIYLCNITTFTFSDNIIYQDVVMQNVPEAYKVNPGPVESLNQHPAHPNKVLIGYQRGLSVLWDMPTLTALQTYVSSQQLESSSWHPDGDKFLSCHNDGSITIWPSELLHERDTDSTGAVNGSVEESCKQPEPMDGPNTIYGPFPCKPINKVQWRRAKGGGNLLIFSGGMQRASHGDRNTVTVMNYSSEAEADNSSSDMHVTFSLSSRVLDFCVTQENLHTTTTDIKQEQLTDASVAGCLLILCEEEIVFIDLCLPEWPVLPQPYLCSLHSSAITCSTLVSAPHSAVYNRIRAAGSTGGQANVSGREFPITGGCPAPGTAPSPDTPQDLFITGHEDGTVRLWCGGGVCMSLLHTVNTATFFTSDDPPADDGAGAEDDDWPPFRKTGMYDPYSDDPRLGVKKVEMCGLSGQLVVAGTAGQIIVVNYTDATEAAEPVKVQPVEVNVVAENDNFVWKSHNKLNWKSEPVELGPGLEVQLLLQLHPPAACTSLHLHSEWGLLACGTAHGFALTDIVAGKNLLAKSTLSSLDVANAADEGPMSRRKSLKKSLRESFRRLRRGRSTRKTTQAAANRPPPKSAAAAVEVESGVRSVERSVESRQQSADYLGSMVRCLHLSKCFLANNSVMSATLWAGTNSGAIYVFTIAIPPSDKRKEVPITVQLGKEIHLKHAAPVMCIAILDGKARPFPPPLAVKKELAPAPDTSAPHKVLICSEEQLKVFTLPQLKPYTKYKLTAIDGSRIRKIGFSDFVSSVDPNYSEPCFTVVTNQGEVSVFSLPECRRQISATCFKKEDINGINSAVFNKSGEMVFLTAPSELMRVSLSAAKITQPRPLLNQPSSAGSKVASDVAAREAVAVTAAAAPAVEQNKLTDEVGGKAPRKDGCNSTTAAGEKAAAAAGEKVTTGEKAAADEKAAAAEHTLQVTDCAAGATKLEDFNGAGDTSLLSGDITIDSIRDHMAVGSNTTIASNTTIGSGSVAQSTTATTTTSSSTTATSVNCQTVTKQTITVIKSSQLVTATHDQQGECSVNTVTETTSSSSNTTSACAAADATVNGTE
uniref:Lethal(2) giant larvae protein homolog 1-like n=3 Tax=Hirondellea gigas TaxID=1518452 RepID=A0A6A7FXL5_9CRUS